MHDLLWMSFLYLGSKGPESKTLVKAGIFPRTKITQSLCVHNICDHRKFALQMSYSKNDIMNVNDVIDIKFCWCQQVSKNYISSESSHQEQSNDTCFK